MMIINGYSEAILRDTFTSTELKGVRGFPEKIAFSFG